MRQIILLSSLCLGCGAASAKDFAGTYVLQSGSSLLGAHINTSRFSGSSRTTLAQFERVFNES